MESAYELDLSFSYDKKCQCSLTKPCLEKEEWQILTVSHVIDLTDIEVGMLLIAKMRTILMR